MRSRKNPTLFAKLTTPRLADGYATAAGCPRACCCCAGATSRRSIPPDDEASTFHRAVDHPGNAEPIDAHAESLGPECLAKRHVHRAALGKRLELALGITGILDLQRDRKTLRLMEMAGRRVGCHQHLAVDRHL